MWLVTLGVTAVCVSCLGTYDRVFCYDDTTGSTFCFSLWFLYEYDRVRIQTRGPLHRHVRVFYYATGSTILL